MSATEMFSCTVTIDHWPFCPACGRPLTPSGITFVRAYAFCTPCAERAHDQVAVALHVLREEVMHRYSLLRDGLYWYANHDGGTRGVDALSLFRRMTGNSAQLDWHTRQVFIVDDPICAPGRMPRAVAADRGDDPTPPHASPVSVA